MKAGFTVEHQYPGDCLGLKLDFEEHLFASVINDRVNNVVKIIYIHQLPKDNPLNRTALFKLKPKKPVFPADRINKY